MAFDWSKNNEKSLVGAIDLNIPIFLPASIRQKHTSRRELIEKIYGYLIDCDIRYALPPELSTQGRPLLPDIQKIRNLDEIKREGGTCLDLAVLFCSICAKEGLLPVIIVVKGHVFAAISLSHSWSDWNLSEREERKQMRDLLKDKNELQNLLNKYSYLVIECTGFSRDESCHLPNSSPEGVGRKEGILPFEKAIDAAKKHLDGTSDRSFEFAIDIATGVHNTWYLPNVPQHSDPSQGISNIYTKMTSLGKSVRSTLDPVILQRIDRPQIDEKYFLAVEESLQSNESSIISIVGSAGSGKTVTLGRIYDAISGKRAESRFKVGWLAIIRCDNRIQLESTRSSQFSMRLSEMACGTSRYFDEIAVELTKVYGKGVLMIDTLDLILSGHFIIEFRDFLQKLISPSIQVTVIFTCRDQEYEEYFSTERGSYFHELKNNLTNPVKVNEWDFGKHEIEKAILAYVTEEKGQVEIKISDNGERFAARILNLETDQRSLKEITRKPLLLSLLCDLYLKEFYSDTAGIASDLTDLTTNRLYQSYWEKRILHSRRYSESREAKLREPICLNLAQEIFRSSVKSKYFSESIAESVLFGVKFFREDPEYVTRSYNELRKDDILQVTGRPATIQFFHQTFSEYAVAVWLKDNLSPKKNLEQLLKILNSVNLGSFQVSWLAVLRQLLTIAKKTEFDQIYEKLDKNEIKIFRTTCYSISSRDEDFLEDALIEIRKIAITREGEYQKTFFQALEYSPVSFADRYLDVSLVLLRKTEKRFVSDSVRIMAFLLTRISCERLFASYFHKTLDAIKQISISESEEFDAKDISLGFFSDFISHCKIRLENTVNDAEILRTLRDFYSEIGSGQQSLILEIYARSSLLDEKVEFVKMLANLPPLGLQGIRKMSKNEPYAFTIFCDTIPHLVGDFNTAIWRRYSDLLADISESNSNVQFSKPLDKFFAKAVGKIASTRPYLMAEIIHYFISYGNNKIIKACTTALHEAIQQSAYELIVMALLMLRPNGIDHRRKKSIDSLLEELYKKVSEEDRLALSKWSDSLEQHSILVHPVSSISTLVEGGKEKSSFLVEKNNSIINIYFDKKSRSEKNKMINDLPSKDLKSLMQELIDQASIGNQVTILELLELSSQQKPDIASKASKGFIEFAHTVEFLKLLPIIRSNISGVRANGLAAILSRMKHSQVSPENIDSVIENNYLVKEKNQEVLKKFFDLLKHWIKEDTDLSQGLMDDIGSKIFRLTEDEKTLLLKDKKLIQLLMIMICKIACNLRKKPANKIYVSKIQDWLKRLFKTVVDKNALSANLIYQTLDAVVQLDKKSDFLDRISEQIPEIDSRVIREGICTIIRDENGKNSLLLTQLLDNTLCPEDTKEFISKKLR